MYPEQPNDESLYRCPSDHLVALGPNMRVFCPDCRWVEDKGRSPSSVLSCYECNSQLKVVRNSMGYWCDKCGFYPSLQDVCFRRL